MSTPKHRHNYVTRRRKTKYAVEEDGKRYQVTYEYQKCNNKDSPCDQVDHLKITRKKVS